MKTAYIFPGQGAQFVGMGKDLYDSSPEAREYFERANEILGYRITDIMFEGSDEELRQTKITQPAVYIHSVITALLAPDFAPDMVAGHSLGEFSALAAVGCLTFEDGLRLVDARARAMQKACERVKSTMALIIGLPQSIVETAVKEVASDEKVVVVANYNGPVHHVLSGYKDAVAEACHMLQEYGASCLTLRVSGGFHSPCMEMAKGDLEEIMDDTVFLDPACPVYQNVDFMPHTNPEVIKANLLAQLTSPVLWCQSVENMISDGAEEFIEYGPDRTLQKMAYVIKANLK